jgi:predicted DNA-binding transcriptional regulator AlpA
MQDSLKLAMNVREVVAASGFSRSAIYAVFRDGRLLRRKNGKRSVVLVSDLKAFLENLPKAEV